MYLCICNAITESDLIKDPSLSAVIGTQCGMCIDEKPLMKCCHDKITVTSLPYTTPEI